MQGLAVELGMQGAQAQVDLMLQDILHGDDGHAVGVLALELAVGDGLLDLFEAIDRDVAIQLAGDDHELAVRGHVHAMGALGLGDQIEEALGDGLLHGYEVIALFLFDLAGLDQFLGLLPVGHMQVVGVLGGAAGLEGRAAALDAAHVALGAEGISEAPTIAGPLAGVGEILAVGPQLKGEGVFGIDAALFLVEFPVGQTAAVFVIEFLQGDEAVIEQRRGVLDGLHDIFGVGGHEGAAMGGLEEGVDDDLLGLEVVQIDDRDARIGLVVDEEPAPVVGALGLRQSGVVGIAIDHILAPDAALGQDRLGLVVEAIALPGFRGEDPDVLEQPHGGDAIDDDLTGLATGTEDHVLIAAAAGDIGLGRRQQVFLAQTAALHGVLQGLGRPGRRGRTHRQDRPDRDG
jgi:hypothetical protein